MHIMYRKPTDLPSAGLLLGQGVLATLLGSAALAAAAWLAASTHPVVHATAGALQVLAPYALACGAAALVTWLVLRPYRAAPDASPTSDAQPLPPRWSEALFLQLAPQGFAALCTELLAPPEWRVRVERIDGQSTDLWLHAAHAMRPDTLIRCRQWNRVAGVKDLRELQGAMASRDVARGTFATTGGFTADARRFARAHGLTLVDVRELLAQVERRTPEQQCALVAFAWAAR